jgi:hypothetical protein
LQVTANNFIHKRSREGKPLADQFHDQFTSLLIQEGCLPRMSLLSQVHAEFILFIQVGPTLAQLQIVPISNVLFPQNIYLTTLIWNAAAIDFAAFAAMSAELIPAQTCIRICMGSTGVAVAGLITRLLVYASRVRKAQNRKKKKDQFKHEAPAPASSAALSAAERGSPLQNKNSTQVDPLQFKGDVEARARHFSPDRETPGTRKYTTARSAGRTLYTCECGARLSCVEGPDYKAHIKGKKHRMKIENNDRSKEEKDLVQLVAPEVERTIVAASRLKSIHANANAAENEQESVSRAQREDAAVAAADAKNAAAAQAQARLAADAKAAAKSAAVVKTQAKTAADAKAAAKAAATAKAAAAAKAQVAADARAAAKAAAVAKGAATAKAAAAAKAQVAADAKAAADVKAAAQAQAKSAAHANAAAAAQAQFQQLQVQKQRQQQFEKERQQKRKQGEMQQQQANAVGNVKTKVAAVAAATAKAADAKAAEGGVGATAQKEPKAIAQAAKADTESTTKKRWAKGPENGQNFALRRTRPAHSPRIEALDSRTKTQKGGAASASASAGAGAGVGATADLVESKQKARPQLISCARGTSGNILSLPKAFAGGEKATVPRELVEYTPVSRPSVIQWYVVQYL